jgi:hypothetical protein
MRQQRGANPRQRQTKAPPSSLARFPNPENVDRARPDDDRHPVLEIDAQKGEMLHQEIHLGAPFRRALPGALFGSLATTYLFYIFRAKNLL